MTDLTRHYRQRCIARTDVRIARFSFGFRPIDVPFEANDTPATAPSSPIAGLGQAGELIVPACPTLVFDPFHEADNAR